MSVPNKRKPPLPDLFIILSLMLWSVFVLDEKGNQFGLYILLPTSFLVVAFKQNILAHNKYIVLLLLLFLWSTFTAFFAVDQAEAWMQIRRMIPVFLMSYVFVHLGRRYTLQGYLIFLLFWVCLLLYAYNHILTAIDYTEGQRLQDEKTNANVFAYFTTFGTFIIFILSYLPISRMWGKIARTAFFLTIPISFYVALQTASRQILVIQIPLITTLLAIRYRRGKTGILRFALIVVAIMVLYFVYGDILLENSFLLERSSNSIEEDERTFLLFDAFRVGFRHILTGVGPGCYKLVNPTKHFAHCAYAEAFACSGLPALLLYISIIGLFIKRQWQRYLKNKNQMYLIFFIYGLTFAIQNIFYAFYLQPWLMAFFILVASHAEEFHKHTSSLI